MATKSIRMDEKLVFDASKIGAKLKRSPAKQIEYWAEIGRVMEQYYSPRELEEIASRKSVRNPQSLQG